MCNCVQPGCPPDIPVPTPTPLPPCPSGELCEEVTDAGCVVYTNEPLPAVNIQPGDRLHDIIRKWALTILNPTQAIATKNSRDVTFTGNGQTLTPLEGSVNLDPNTHNLIYKTDKGLITKVTLCLIQDFVSLVTADSEAHQLFCDLVSTCAAGYCGSATDLEVEFIDSVLRANWVAFTANATSQVVQYRKLGATGWTNFSTVGANVESVDIPGLIPNTVYEVRIQTNCYIGGPAYNTPFIVGTVICPTVVKVASYDNVSFSFKHIPNDYPLVNVTLIKATSPQDLQLQVENNTIGSKDYVLTGNTPKEVSGNFTGLEPATQYKLILTFSSPLGPSYTFTCPRITVTTLAPPSCSIPGGLVVLPN